MALIHLFYGIIIFLAWSYLGADTPNSIKGFIGGVSVGAFILAILETIFYIRKRD